MITHVGLVKTSLVDVPGRLAATLFTHGCPLSCPYCHNERLRSGPIPEDFVEVADALAFLRRRIGVLEAVCVTGGEPLVHDDLGELVDRIGALGYYVKLDTSGAYPERLRDLLSRGIVDMVALDVKTSPGRYRRVGLDGDTFLESLSVVRRSGVPYELRTTAAPNVVRDEDIEHILRLLDPSERYVIAQYRMPDSPGEHPRPYPGSVITRWLSRVCEKNAAATTRGV